MRIAHCAPPDAAVPPHKYGGTQLVIYDLCEEMVRQGHEVFLLASGDSSTSAHLVPVCEKNLFDSLGNRYADLRHYYKLLVAGKMAEELLSIKPDVIINHHDWRFLMLSEIVGVPVINLMHIIKKRPEDLETFKLFKNSNFVSISNNQRKDMPELNWVKTIYHGIDVQKFPYSEEKDDYFAFLGRTSPDKGLGEICQMIRKTSYKLKIGAKIDTQDSVAYEYYKTQVEPYVDGEQIEYLGELGFEEKTRMLSRAKAMLMWLTWEEPFGLVFIESLACATPVIVTGRGSAPEIIEDGKTGFLVSSIDEMREQMGKVGVLSPRVCRETAERRFSRERMAREYIELAEQITAIA